MSSSQKKQEVATEIDQMIREPEMLGSFELSKLNLEYISELRKTHALINP
jgi:hypothetical protein